MISYTDVTITTTKNGQNTVGTLDGSISIQEGRGRLVVYDSVTQRELNVVDRTGYLFSNATDRKIKIGLDPSDDSNVGIWVAKPGLDVINELNT